ncbi:TonB family protein [Methylacidiphilum caldifontis]|uniref:TonB family protein n=1 Tax=Methylacidiphilum caldifontis TaxID=2795386 RepID=UPI001A8ECBD1|nr:TonB family protein [Methylacidiphilum caldifontis]QSR88017.1 TonB family protein [Methylacidiphilum caldifontis]
MSLMPTQQNRELKGRNLFWKVFLIVFSLHFILILAFFMISALKKTRKPKISSFNIVSTPLNDSSHSSSKTPLAEQPKKEAASRSSSLSPMENIQSHPSTQKSLAQKTSQKSVSVSKKEFKNNQVKAQQKHTVIPNLTEVSRKIPPEAKSHSSEEKDAHDQNSADSPEHYYALIREKLYSVWDQPVDLLGLGLYSVVEITIDDMGAIVKYRLLQSSGNEKFDQSTLLAVERLESIGQRRPWDIPKVITVKFQMEK